jgi:integrase
MKLSPGTLRRKERVRQRDKKRTFTRAELQTLFQHAFWTNENAARGIPSWDQRRVSGLYWVPLICAYTGMRREEISGFSPEYFKEEDGIWYFELVPTSTRRLKTAASVRRIPVHCDLISLGLCDVVQHARKRHQSLLFPDLQEPSSKIFGRKVGRFMEKLVTEIWATSGEGLSLQSARHYVQHVLDLDKLVPEKVSRELMGHEGTDVHSTVYGDQCPITDLKAAIDRLPSLIDLQEFPKGRIR